MKTLRPFLALLLLMPSLACAVGPVNGVLDDFNRADENPLVTTGMWENEIDLDGNVPCRIISNALVHQVSGDGTCYTDATYGPPSECFFSIPDDGGSTGNYAGCYIRVVDAGGNTPDGYHGRWINNSTGTDSAEIYRMDDGGDTLIAGPFSQEFSAGDRLLLRGIGATICLDYYNGATWSELGCVSGGDSTYSAAGRIGAGTNTQNIPLDDFGGGTLPTAAGAFPRVRMVQ